jgi:hypothetical protein
MKPPRFHPDAEAEYEQAIAFYADINPALGVAYLSRVEAAWEN